MVERIHFDFFIKIITKLQILNSLNLFMKMFTTNFLLYLVLTSTYLVLKNTSISK